MSKSASGRSTPSRRRLQPPTAPAATRHDADIRREHTQHAFTPTRVFAFLLALRIANALVVRAFFQPDEYFQSLEPAWQLAFGPDSGAWITWV